MYFWCYFVLSNHSNWEFICIIPIFEVIFGQNMGIWPPGVIIYRVTPTVLPLILKKYHYGLSWMYFCCYFVLSNHSNWEFICIIPVFEVIFGQNMGIWPPGVLIYRVTPLCFAIYFEEIVSHFMLNATFLIFCTFERSEMSKSDYFDFFLSKIRRLTPRDDNKGSYPPGWS